MSADTLIAESTTRTNKSEASPRQPASKKLWQRYQKTGQGSSSENELIQQYLPLVKTVVGRIAMSLPSHVDQEDLHSAGLVGLLHAVRRYDTKAGVAFETYARVRIRGAVFDELRRLDWVPRSVHDKARKVEETLRLLEQKKGRTPSEVEMAEAMDMSLEEYQQLQQAIRPATFICLDSVRNSESDDGATQYESVADTTQMDPCHHAGRRELAYLVTQRLEQLPEVQRKVLALYYFEDMRLREIAEIFGVTESRICQIHAQAIQTIKAYLRKQDSLPA